MYSLQVFKRFDKGGIELVINTTTGESFATQSGYSRMSGISVQGVAKRYRGIINRGDAKSAEIETTQGVRVVKLIDEDTIAQWLPKDNPSMATQLLKLGIRGFMHELAGYHVTSTAIAPSPAQFKIPQSYAEALLEAGRLALENEKMSAKIEQDAPLVAFAEIVKASDDAIEMNDFAKAINTGRTRLFRDLRALGVIMQNSTLPYQKYIEAGYFKVSEKIAANGKIEPFALVTGKGQVWLSKKLRSAHPLSNVISIQGCLAL